MKFKRYSNEEVLQGSKTGFEFEFYSSMEVQETARSLAKYLGKRVVVPMSMSSLDSPKPLYHSPVKPTDSIFKLEPDYSGGKKMCELVTGPIKYADAKNVLIKVFEWIRSNGYTNDRCSIHVNLSIDPNKIKTHVPIPQMNFAKFILSFDENSVYKVFPKRKDSVYAQSIDKISPNKILFYTSGNTNYGRDTLTLPVDEKYYGVNFLKAEKGYLEYRYMGGAGYEKQQRPILELVDYFIIHLYDTLNFNGQFNSSEISRLKTIMERQEKLQKAYVKYAEFKKAFPKFKVTVDMNDMEEVVEAYWNNIRGKIYDVIGPNKVVKGEYNYDTDFGANQIKNCKLKNVKLDDYEIINCEIEGILNNCKFYGSTIKNSRIQDCKSQNTEFVSSKVAETELSAGNKCTDCFIENKRSIINCEVEGGVIRNGEIGKLAKISKETQIVEQIEPVETPGNFKDESRVEKNKENARKKK